MIGDRIEETANSPGTNSVVQLLGALAGWSFLDRFGDSGRCYYEIASDSMWEIGKGTITSGSPNTLTRTDVIRNSSRTTSRLNFTGTVRVFCTPPWDAILFAGDDGAFDARSKRISSLAAGTIASDALRMDQSGGVILQNTNFSTARASWTATLPNTYARFRLEWEDVTATAGTGEIYFRLSNDGGFTYFTGAADYPQRKTQSNASTLTAGGGAQSYGSLTAASVNVSMGALEFQTTGARAWRAWSHTVVGGTSIHTEQTSSGWSGQAGARATNVMVSAVSGQLAQGRFRLKGIY